MLSDQTINQLEGLLEILKNKDEHLKKKKQKKVSFIKLINRSVAELEIIYTF
jgi:hypothetical protein